MDNFKAVYKILSTLEKAMDIPEFDLSQVASEQKMVENMLRDFVRGYFETNG